MYLVETKVGHPRLEAWKYPLPGDEVVTRIQRVMIGLDGPKVVRLRSRRITIWSAVATTGLTCGGAPDAKHLAFVSTSRDHGVEKYNGSLSKGIRMTSLFPFLLSCLLAVSAVLLVQASEKTGIKMTIHRQVFEGNPTEHTIYLQGDRKRMEFRNYAGLSTANGSQQRLAGPRLASITRCDLGRIFELNLDGGEYVSAPYPPRPRPLTQTEIEMDLKIWQSDKPTLRIEITTVNTGERKEVFGFTARHVVITRKEIPLRNSRRRPQEAVTDGWYIDLDPHISCEPWVRKGRLAHAYMATSVHSAKGSVTWEQPPERPEFVDIGEPETGFPVQSRIVSKVAYTLPDGISKETISRDETLVTGLELGPLDPALFEIPAGFKQVDHIERNPRVSPRSGQDLWERFKAKLTSFFSLLDSSNTKPKG